MTSKRLLIVVVSLAACSSKKADPNAESKPSAPAKPEAPVAVAPPPPAEPATDLPANKIVYDLPMVAEHKGAFDVSFALLHLGREDSGQGDLVVFGPDVKEGDKGNASDWTDVCSTRLNAFPYAGVHGFKILISNIKQLPAAPAKLEPSTVAFDLQGDGWALSQKVLNANKFEPELQLVRIDGKEAVLDVRIREPGKDGSVRGRVRAKICPQS